MSTESTRTRSRAQPMCLLIAVLLCACGSGGPNDLFGCDDPASQRWQINVNRSPMVVVDNTPQIRIGERLDIGVFTDERFFCPAGDPKSSVSWQLSNPAVATLTTLGRNDARLQGTAPGETGITAQLTFVNGSQTQTST